MYKMVEYIEIQIKLIPRYYSKLYRYIIMKKSKNEKIIKEITEEFNEELIRYEKEKEVITVMSNKGAKKLMYSKIKNLINIVKKDRWEEEMEIEDIFIDIDVKHDDESNIHREPHYFLGHDQVDNIITKEEEIKESIDNIFELYEEVRINQNDIKKILIENTKNEITKTFPVEIINMITNYI